jgi:hypothetical protein
VVKNLNQQRYATLMGWFSIEGFNNLEQSEFFKKYHAINTHAHVPFNLYWIQEQRFFCYITFKTRTLRYADCNPRTYYSS